MNIVLDEARKRNMRVWILDDSHFPTGFANGAVENAPNHLRRQSIYTYSVPVNNKTQMTIDLHNSGFFSDEPEIGNGYYFSNQIRLGKNVDQPWSRELEIEIEKKLGKDWTTKLVLL